MKTCWPRGEKTALAPERRSSDHRIETGAARSSFGRVPRSSLLGLIAGIGLIGFLLARSDLAAVLAAVAHLRGWLILIVAWHAAPLLCDALAWRRLFPAPLPRLSQIARARWVGEGVNALLPVPLLGEVLRARLTRTSEHGTVTAAAAVVADITLGLASQLPFTIAGLLLLRLGGGNDVAIGSTALILPLGLFAVALYGAQRTGWLAGAAQRLARSLGRSDLFDVAKLRRFDEDLQAAYRRHRAVVASVLWHLAGWIVGAGETWILLNVLGAPVGPVAAIVLESLSQAARAAAFVVPGGLGVQDAALVALAGHYGVPLDVSVSMALAKRMREVVLGVPAIVAAWALEQHGARRGQLDAAAAD